jgi:choline dehydrogenase-like flavoprotein
MRAVARGDSPAGEAVDVVIVGSGPCGAAWARTVSDHAPAARILLVDAGPVVSDPPGAHVNTIVDPVLRASAKVASQGPTMYSYGISSPEERALGHRSEHDGSPLAHTGLFLLGSAQRPSPEFPAASMANSVGGMGAHWFGSAPRAFGSERMAFLDPAALDEAYDRAELLLRVSSTQFAGSEAAARRERILGERFDRGRSAGRRVQPMPIALSREAGGTGQSGPAVILGPLLGAGHGDTFALRPGTLCKRVLMDGDRATGVELVDLASGATYEVGARCVVVAADALRSPQLLYASGVRPPALGRHLNEHPYLDTRVELDAPGDEARIDDPYDMTVYVSASGVTWIPFDEERFPLQAGIAERNRILAISLFVPQDVEWENRVAFSDTAQDWRGMPEMQVHYGLSDSDRERIGRAGEVMLEVAEAFGIPLDAPPEPMPGGTSLHYQGTVRMGPEDDGTSVCDRDSRVWGTENLFVAGNGVIATSTACNPTLTSVALSVLGARAAVRDGLVG